MAAAKAKTWKLLESEADESTKHSPVKADTVGNDNLENNKLCVLVPIHKPTDRFSINPGARRDDLKLQILFCLQAEEYSAITLPFGHFITDQLPHLM